MLAIRRLRKRVDLGLRPVGAPALIRSCLCTTWWSGGLRGAGQSVRAGAPESGREALAYACHRRGAVSVVVPSPAHITEPVLRHTALGQCSRDGLHATVCRHRFLSVRSICLASWSTGPRWA